MRGPGLILRTQLGGWHPAQDSVCGKGDPARLSGSSSLSPKPPHGLMMAPSGQFLLLKGRCRRSLLSPPSCRGDQ